MIITEREKQMEDQIKLRENEQRVRQMISDKINHITESRVEKPRLTYSQAKEQGNVGVMLSHRLGIFAGKDQEAELESLYSAPIKEVVKEYSTITTKIETKRGELDSAISKAKEDIEQAYIQEMKAHRANGGMRAGIAEIMIQDTRLKALDTINDAEGIQALKADYKGLQTRSRLLAEVQETYINDNASLIKEELRQRKLKELQESGLLDIIK